MKIIDLSFTIENGMPTCGTSWHVPVEIQHLGKIEEVGRNTHSITLGSHTGTHMDAPYHFIERGNTIDNIDLEQICGDVNVIDFSHIAAGRMVQKKDVEAIMVKSRMLFIFKWYKKWKTSQYYKDFPFFSEEAVEYLIEGGMKVFAMDTPSPDNGSAIGVFDDSPNHKKLLQKGIVIIEYLNNTELINLHKKYELIALPLKIEGSDGSPSRVILIEKES